MSYAEEYFKQKAEAERKRIEAEAMKNLMDIDDEVFGKSEPQPEEPQDIDDAIKELEEALGTKG